VDKLKKKILLSSFLIALCVFTLLQFIHSNDQEMEITIIKNTELSTFNKQVYFNGRLVTETDDSVMSDLQMIYLSSEFLETYYGFDLIDERGTYKLSVRRSQLVLTEIVEYKGELYVPMNDLEKYIHYNHHLLQNGNVLYLDNMMPDNVTFNKRAYQRSDNRVNKTQLNNDLIEIAEDGRGIFKADDQNSIWVEDDFGKLWEYRLPDWGID
jgi:hypothetical protein